MSTHLPGFQSFSRFLHHFIFAKIATSGIRVNPHAARAGLRWFSKNLHPYALDDRSLSFGRVKHRMYL